MKKFQDVIALFFILCVFVLTVVSILGVWDVFGDDVVTKSLQTIGLLAVVSLIVMAAIQFIDSHKRPDQNISDNGLNNVFQSSTSPMPIFSVVRHTSIVFLIISTVLLAFCGVLSIWDVVTGDVLQKSLSSIGIIIFSSSIITLACLNREGRKIGNFPVSSGWAIFAIIAVIWIIYRII